MLKDLIQGFPVIETERLMLRESNDELMKKAATALSDREIMAFYGLHRQEELAVELERARIGMRTAYISFKIWYLIPKLSRRIIGFCGFHDWAFRHFRAELGYAISDQEDKQQGYMTEALDAVIRYGFEQMGLNRIAANIAPDNHPSLRIVEKMGFVREGYLRQHHYVDGKLHDAIAFSLLKGEWGRKTQKIVS